MAHAVGRVAAPAIRNAPLWLEQHLRTPWSSPALVPHLRGEQGALLVEEIIDAFETADKLGAPVKIRTLLALLGLSKAERAAAGVDRQLMRLLDLADKDRDEWVCVVASMVRSGVFGAPSGKAQPTDRVAERVKLLAASAEAAAGVNAATAEPAPYFLPKEYAFLSRRHVPPTSSANPHFQGRSSCKLARPDRRPQSSASASSSAGPRVGLSAVAKPGYAARGAQAARPAPHVQRTAKPAMPVLGRGGAANRKKKIARYDGGDPAPGPAVPASAPTPAPAAATLIGIAAAANPPPASVDSRKRPLDNGTADIDASAATAKRSRADAAPIASEPAAPAVTSASASAPPASDGLPRSDLPGLTPAIVAVVGDRVNILTQHDCDVIEKFLNHVVHKDHEGKSSTKIKLNESFVDEGGVQKRQILSLDLDFATFRWEKKRKVKVVK
mmetsp:Transcript_29591/g.68698  ORF Transcript_29591/g.68698 Transcript_29591/m.68698 type:complete len:442 (+) Transcript_29591:49-1374(+)